jgi:hypothetical protein
LKSLHAYGGRSANTEITVQSGFVELIEDGDVILADKGFPNIETDVNKTGGSCHHLSLQDENWCVQHGMAVDLGSVVRIPKTGSF